MSKIFHLPYLSDPSHQQLVSRGNRMKNFIRLMQSHFDKILLGLFGIIFLSLLFFYIYKQEQMPGNMASWVKDNQDAIEVALLLIISLLLFLAFILIRYNLVLQKHAERRIRQSEARFFVIAQLNPIPTFISEAETGRFVYVNDAFGRLFRMAPNDIIGKTSIDLQFFNAASRKEFADTVLGKLGKTENIDVKITVQGQPRDMLLCADVINFDHKKCIIATTQDISERKKAEESARKALEKEKELNAMKSNFVATASHEFRTPLTSILSSAVLLERYTTTEQQPNRERHISRIKSSTANLVQILEELLSLEKIESGKVPPKLTNFDIEDFIQKLCADFRETSRKGQSIIYEHTGAKLIDSDQGFLRHVLTNLISNAVKYSPENTTIHVSSTVNNDFARFSVRDSGIGISQEDQKNLFQRFYRASNASHVGGTGLGLHIAKRYIDILKGTITVNSELDKGSEFVVEVKRVLS
jgi:PAS domain S-box-containing protein